MILGTWRIPTTIQNMNSIIHLMLLTLLNIYSSPSDYEDPYEVSLTTSLRVPMKIVDWSILQVVFGFLKLSVVFANLSSRVVSTRSPSTILLIHLSILALLNCFYVEYLIPLLFLVDSVTLLSLSIWSLFLSMVTYCYAVQCDKERTTTSNTCGFLACV